MARFRLFARAGSPPPYPAPGYDRGAPDRAGPPWPRSASAWPTQRDPGADPPTDPHGFAPVPVPIPAARVTDATPATPGRPAPEPAPHPAEAAALAGAFAVDYLSWDEDDPTRRGRVLLDYLPAAGDLARLGWSGRGRQRAEFALPGLVRPDGDGRVLVDVRVRVTPYRVVGEHGPEPTPPAGSEPEVAGIPAAAPAPTGRGWRSLPSYWIRINVPVTVDGGRLIVDAWEETMGEEAPPPPPARPGPPEDHSLADDDPLAEAGTAADRPAGAW